MIGVPTLCSRTCRQISRPADARQDHVQGDQVEPALQRQLEAFLAVSRGEHLKLLGLHGEGQGLPQDPIILDQQDFFHDACLLGRITRNVLPAEGRLSTRISPPCASTICRTILRPRPTPWGLTWAAPVPR